MSAIESQRDGPEARAPTRRAIAKQQTRSRVLAAARKLFAEHGYERATIRDIAAAAQMSTGAVFANFADKSDLFHEIMRTDVGKVRADMLKVAAEGRDVADALVRMFEVGYRFYLPQLPLARAAFSVAWSPAGPVLAGGAYGGGFDQVFRRVLEIAVARGELRQDFRTALLAEMICESYLANYPLLIYQQASLDAVLDRARAQVAILIAGAQTY
jgi:AcrR family transcriptional regulator